MYGDNDSNTRRWSWRHSHSFEPVTSLLCYDHKRFQKMMKRSDVKILSQPIIIIVAYITTLFKTQVWMLNDRMLMINVGNFQIKRKWE